jgi:hypothetical protein
MKISKIHMKALGSTAIQMQFKSKQFKQKMTVFWNIVLSSLVEVYHRFRGACCLRHQGIESS